MNNQINQTRNSFRHELARLFFISVGVFLFILFFQPFPLNMLDYNNRLLYVTGFGGITFLLGCVALIVTPLAIPKWFQISKWESGPPFILNLILLILTVTAFAFYIRYVGMNKLSLYILFKIVLVCLLPILILVILYKNKSLEQLIESLQKQNKLYSLKIKEFEISMEDEKFEIVSDTKADKIELKYRNIVSIRSADNYIEVYYLENEQLEKKLIRNTLKHIEAELAHRRSFIRCHRTSIINVLYIDKLVRNTNGYSLKMSCFEDEIPISRQYLMQVKEAIKAFE